MSAFSIMTFIIILLFILIILILFLIIYLFKGKSETDNQIKELKKQINDLGISSYLQKALNKNMKNFSEKKMAFLEKQYHKIMNSYKILYYREISNLILERLFKIHGANFSKTKAIFKNYEKPEYKQKKFPIICVGKSFDKILNVDKYLINLIIDFLMYMKDFTSSIIHLSELSDKLQIKILSQYIGHKVENINNKYYINSKELINFLFPQDNINNKILDKSSIQNNLNINIIDNNIDNNIYNNQEINNNILPKKNINEPKEYSTEISDNSKNGKGNSHENQNRKNDFSKVSQRNNDKKDLNNNNNEKNINKNINGPLSDDDIAINDIPYINNQKSNISGNGKTDNIKNNIIKKKDKIKKIKSEVNKINKNYVQRKEDIEKANIFNDKLNQDLSENEADNNILKFLDNLINSLEGNDKKQNLNNILNSENKNNENDKFYSYDVKEMEIVLFNDDFKFKDDRVEIIKEIKEYAIKISKIQSDKMDEAIKIDTNYIFNSWCNTFDKEYKKNKLYSKLVQINRYPDLSIDKFKDALLLLIPNEKFEILPENPSRLDNIIDNILCLKEIETY